jgi:periplasmic divalent cation tolerance protein
VTPFPLEPARALGPMRLVLSAYPSVAAAREAVEGALERRLAACASVLGAESRYWWRGSLESATESLVVFKTTPKRVGALVRFLKERHPYEVPEIAEVDVPRVEPAYLAYLERTLDTRPPGAEPGRPPRRWAGRRAPGARRPARTRGPHRRPSR